MSLLKDEILDYNQKFVENKDFKKFASNKYPNRQLAILSCMDTRLTELLPASMGIKNGQAKIIKTAGASISHPFGTVMRSLLVSIYELGVKEIMVIGHTECGMQCFDSKKFIKKMTERGISEQEIKSLSEKVNIDNWLHGFENVEDSVKNSVKIISGHPLIPKDIIVNGYIIDINTGKLSFIV